MASNFYKFINADDIIIYYPKILICSPSVSYMTFDLHRVSITLIDCKSKYAFWVLYINPNLKKIQDKEKNAKIHYGPENITSGKCSSEKMSGWGSARRENVIRGSLLGEVSVGDMSGRGNVYND